MFQLRERGSTVWTEIRGGVVTYLTLSYILFVQPAVLSVAGIPPDPVAAAVRRHVRPWHPFKEEWIAQSTVIAVADYRRGHYPCVDLGNGRLGMPIQSTFVVGEWLKRAGAVKEFDVHACGGESGPFPHDLVTGRKYMVFMKPDPEGLARLNDAKTVFRLDTAIRSTDLVAIIDLSQTKEEAEAEKVVATKSGALDGFEFTPEKWARLRQAERTDFAEQGRFLRFIEQGVLKPGATLADVRSWLGPPDRYYRNEDGLYYEYALNLPAYNKPRVDAVFTRLEVSFAPCVALAGHSIKHYKYTEVTPESQIIRELTAEERRQLGL
ncbi:MAG: hypothetical protein NTX87_11550 [Planctomycetota bacterium]|nr:hypothetical protein [Planctomycetota bacterium]